mmetsp:Transcript_3587/g.10425  ORF Transcript_3587/g.10425 Transcript_3587/m.10425 type:complete len:174 (-) Transcript_3587:837-1358(-)
MVAQGGCGACGADAERTCSEVSFSSSRMMARARATRFFMPPDSSAGMRLSTPLRPTCPRLRATSSLMRSVGSLECSYNRNPTFSPTVKLSKRAPLWNTKPSCKPFPAASSSEARPCLRTPLTKTSPLSGASRPAISRRVVLFPVPDPPMMPIACPRRTCIVAPCRMRLVPKDL